MGGPDGRPDNGGGTVEEPMVRIRLPPARSHVQTGVFKTVAEFLAMLGLTASAVPWRGAILGAPRAWVPHTRSQPRHWHFDRVNQPSSALIPQYGQAGVDVGHVHQPVLRDVD